MLVLERYCYSPTQGTFARLFLPDAELVTVEQPWRGNRPFESCVPEGIYGLVGVDSPRFGRTVALEMETDTALVEGDVFIAEGAWSQSGAEHKAPALLRGMAPTVLELVEGRGRLYSDARLEDL